MTDETLNSKCVVITGASRGIGGALAEHLAQFGCHVIGIHRPRPTSLHTGPSIKDPIDWIEIEDISQEDQILKISREIRSKTSKIDFLFNCAGISSKSSEFHRAASSELGSLSLAALTRMFQVNSMAPILLTQEIRDLLKSSSSARVINLSSRDASFSLKTSGGNYGYTASKIALNMMNLALAHDLKTDGVISVAIHPGWVRTDMGGTSAPLSPQVAAEMIFQLALQLQISQSGSFLDIDGSPHQI